MFNYSTLYITLTLTFWSVQLAAQDQTGTTLGFEDFIKIVSEHHPVSQQAQLRVDYGEANLLKSKGAFDPKLQSYVAQKYFDGKTYYSLMNHGLHIPTRLGIKLNAGYENNAGEFLNSENLTPDVGLIYTGISVPIGQGLIIDERRAELRKAQIYQNATELQRQVILNNLIHEAAEAYWDWWLAYQELNIYNLAVDVANTRLTAVRQSVIFGDRPAIDTLEATIQVQNREVQAQQALLKYTNQTVQLSTFLWLEGTVPLEINADTNPDTTERFNPNPVKLSYFAILDTGTFNHPELMLYYNKIEQLNVQRSWQKEQLKPTLNVKYNPITAAVGGSSSDAYSINNFTWGLEFSMPILLRKERGNLAITDISIQNTTFGYKNKNADLQYKAKATLNEWQTTYDQVMLYQQTVNNAQGLMIGEQQLFQTGESSLFMVNRREQAYIKARLKLAELTRKNQLGEIKTKYSLGLLGL